MLFDIFLCCAFCKFCDSKNDSYFCELQDCEVDFSSLCGNYDYFLNEDNTNET